MSPGEVSRPASQQKDLVLAKAEEALEIAGGDWAQAAGLYREWIAADPDLAAAVTAPLLDQAIWYLIRRSAHASRRYAWNGDGGPMAQRAREDSEGLRLLAAHNLLLYPMLGGRHLGECNKAEVAETANMHRSLTRSNALRARWFEAIDRHLEEGQLVKDVLTHDQLQALMDEALKGSDKG